MSVSIQDDSTFLVKWWFQLDAQIAIIARLFRYQNSTAGERTTSALIDAAFGTNGLQGALPALIPASAKFLGTSYVPSPNPDQLRPAYHIGGAHVGTFGTVSLPKQTCGLITFYSPVQGKHGQGRNYIPFPPVDANELHGVPTASYVTQLTNLGAVMITPALVQGVSGDNGLMFPVLRPIPGVAGDAATINGRLAHTAWATQRRRSDFGKLNVSPFI